MRVLFALLAAVFFVIPAQAGEDATKSKGLLHGVSAEVNVSIDVCVINAHRI